MKRYIYVLALIVLALAIAGCGSSGSTVANDTKAIDAGLREWEKALDFSRVGHNEVASRDAMKACGYNEPKYALWHTFTWVGKDHYTFISWDISQSGNTAIVKLRYTYTLTTDNLVSKEEEKTFAMQRFGDRWLVNLSDWSGHD